MNKYKKHILANGLRVILVPQTDTKAVTALVLFKVGSRNEQARINGISHFIEHMMFKGTVKRPNTIDISRTLDGVGAEYNAFTGKDMTGYYIKTAADKIELSLDMLSDMLMNSKFAAKELERERGVIIEEINMYEDNPRINIENDFDSLVFKGSPLALTVLGPKKVISSVIRSDFIKYMQQYYSAENMVIAIAGYMNEAKIKKLGEKYFSRFSTDNKRSKLMNNYSQQNSTRVKFTDKKTEQAHLMLGFPAFSDTDKQQPVLKLLSTILGGGMSSRLFIEARERRGLCYFIRSEVNKYEDTGNLVIRAGLDIKRLEQAVDVILKQLKKLKTDLVNAAELKKAKEYIKGTTILGLEDSEAQAGWYARECLFKDQISTPAQKLKKIQAVKASDIQKVAQALFQSDKLNLAVIGPIKSVSADKIKKNLKI
jgi:predicted Zn-dependent peptidase